ncbi:hypothetical protein [Mucilaginibacter sp. NFX135]|uniref:hypothetical protein n=1 Tax=Mucilaginibacter sp. NFX135 TaxID=3402687 RepID=UPI003AFAB714
MSAVELEIKTRKVVEEPRISLTMMGRLVVASERAKLTIIKNSKYPSDFVPGYHEMARKCICNAFEGNFKDDYDLYFDEFKRKAKEYRKAATAYPREKVMYKNNFYSAEGLDGIIAMATLLTPILEYYTFYSNLDQKKNAIMLNSVRIGTMADIHLHDQYGLDHIGFLKFNFSKTKFPAEEAAVKLLVLKKYYDSKNISLNPRDCILVDVAYRRIYSLDGVPDATKPLNMATILVRDNWYVI